MAKIIIDDKEIDCREGIPVLQAALEAGWDVPHYCYHPGLSIVASCRLCLMEMKLPHPKTREMGWAPKLFPACQTPVRDGLEVRFASEVVTTSRERCMEYFLLNHPLDCPVCDQAGECHLQDYSYAFGRPASRMVEQKQVNPKKDIGPGTLLYSDRCVMCSRCVRFTKEVSGTAELCVTSRGSRAEIDVFPGRPLDNALQGNVVDICPVGALLDKDFLFKQRVWFLQSAKSICPGCSTGCAVRVDAHDGVVYRLKPRYNPGVNDWWMCDQGRFGWKYGLDGGRLSGPTVRRGASVQQANWDDIPEMITYRFEEHVAERGSAGVAVMLSPMMSCEEAWLLLSFMQKVAPEVTAVLGPVPVEGEDESFPVGATGEAVKFVIRKEKCPNRRGVEAVMAASGCATLEFKAFVARAGEGNVSAAWIVGGYPSADWVPGELVKAVGKIELVVVQDLFETKLTPAAAIALPACAFTERAGSFMNHEGRLQPFDRAVSAPDGCQSDGQYLYALAGYEGVYNAGRVRELMAATMPEFARLSEAPAVPAHQH
ncbi:MAG: molybdopterin-dependent oxidoreductase [Phycisphaerae bacterium]